MITNIVKILVVVEKNGNISFYTDTQRAGCLDPEIRIYQKEVTGYVMPSYDANCIRELE